MDRTCIKNTTSNNKKPLNKHIMAPLQMKNQQKLLQDKNFTSNLNNKNNWKRNKERIEKIRLKRIRNEELKINKLEKNRD